MCGFLFVCLSIYLLEKQGNKETEREGEREKHSYVQVYTPNACSSWSRELETSSPMSDRNPVL